MAPFGHFLDGFPKNTSKIPGFREFMMPWSITTGESSHAPPALIASALIDFGKAMPVV